MRDLRQRLSGMPGGRFCGWKWGLSETGSLTEGRNIHPSPVSSDCFASTVPVTRFRGRATVNWPALTHFLMQFTRRPQIVSPRALSLPTQSVRERDLSRRYRGNSTSEEYCRNRERGLVAAAIILRCIRRWQYCCGAGAQYQHNVANRNARITKQNFWLQSEWRGKARFIRPQDTKICVYNLGAWWDVAWILYKFEQGYPTLASLACFSFRFAFLSKKLMTAPASLPRTPRQKKAATTFLFLMSASENQVN